MSNPLRKFGKRKVTVPSAPSPPLLTMQGRLLFKRGGGVTSSSRESFRLLGK